MCCKILTVTSSVEGKDGRSEQVHAYLAITKAGHAQLSSQSDVISVSLPIKEELESGIITPSDSAEEPRTIPESSVSTAQSFTFYADALI